MKFCEYGIKAALLRKNVVVYLTVEISRFFWIKQSNPYFLSIHRPSKACNPLFAIECLT
jgi:hypothetical protein